MKLSIVTTLYQSSSHIHEFYHRSTTAVKKVGYDYEIIFVNDGSPDDSVQKAITLSQSDSHVKVIDLSRNFGHHKAIMTALSYSEGDLVFLIDSDLEEDPEWLITFFQRINESQCDVIYGVQETRKGGIIERWSGNLFYRFFNSMSGITVPRNLVTARLMTRQYVSELLRHEESELMIAGLWTLTGFDQRPEIVQKHHTSATTYTFANRLALLVDSITSFSSKPLIFIFYFGLLMLLISGVFISYLLVSRFYFANLVSGWTSVIVSIWFLGGMMISFLGIIGIYVSKVFIETKKRPYVIVRKVYGKSISKSP